MSRAGAEAEPVMGRCDVCATKHERGRLRDATLTDDSGGSAVAICRDCWERITHSRCGVCGELKAVGAKADALIPHDGERIVPVCDDCRSSIIFMRGATS